MTWEVSLTIHDGKGLDPPLFVAFGLAGLGMGMGEVRVTSQTHLHAR